MQKKHIITIGGKPGSGKSTASKGVAKRLDYEFFSSGGLFRAIASERGSDVLQANLQAEKDANIDYLVDARLQDIGRNKDRLVIDSRMAWHWMPQSFKVYLDLDLEVAAQRILSVVDSERIAVEKIPEDPAVYAATLKDRLDSEARRYASLYDVNPFDTTHYDLVVDTHINDPSAVVDVVLAEYQKWLES